MSLAKKKKIMNCCLGGTFSCSGPSKSFQYLISWSVAPSITLSGVLQTEQATLDVHIHWVLQCNADFFLDPSSGKKKKKKDIWESSTFIIITKIGCCKKGHLIKCKKPFSERWVRMEVKCSCLSRCQWSDLTRKTGVKKQHTSSFSNFKLTLPLLAALPTSWLSLRLYLSPQLGHLGHLELCGWDVSRQSWRLEPREAAATSRV